jgi:hypothetical protein
MIGTSPLALMNAAPRCRDDLPPSLAGRVTVDKASGCWKAGGYLDKDGYARFRGEPAHRAVWEMYVGPIAAGLVLDHVRARGCAWRNCILIRHLQPVTVRTNTQRGKAAAKDVCSHGHELDLFSTIWYQDGRRDCRKCVARRQREYKQRLRQQPGAVPLFDLERAA